MPGIRLACSLLISLSLFATAVAQNKPRLLDKDTFFEMESVGNPEISPDGKQIIFTRTWVDKMKDQYRSNLWITDVDGARVRELTSGARNDSSPVWSPDGKRIAFLSDRDGTNQLHVMWLDTREAAQLTHLEQAPNNIKWSPDGKWIAFTSFAPDTDPILNVKLPERPRGAEWAKPAVIVDRLSWASDGRGPVPKGNTQVFVIDATIGGTPRQITSGKFNHNGFDWAADGKTIFVSGIRKPDAEYTRNDSEIYSVDLGSLEIKALTDRKGPDGNPSVSPDGKYIAYVGYDDKMYTSHVSSLYLMNADGSGKRVLADKLDSTPQNVGWWPTSNG
ncbi:MAG: DPP IV N-terminal domain-containing protein, partial [Blastocatellia bacterium]